MWLRREWRGVREEVVGQMVQSSNSLHPAPNKVDSGLVQLGTGHNHPASTHRLTAVCARLPVWRSTSIPGAT